MSGSSSTTAALVGAQSVDLLACVREVQRRIGPFALVGGLAVLARLSAPHRATEDLDTLRRRDADQPSGLDLLVGSAGVEQIDAAGVLLQHEGIRVRVDLLEAVPKHAEHRSEDPTDRLHVAAYLWAYATAEPIAITGTDGSRSVTAKLPVATAGALVAMKFKSCLDDRPKSKEATDVVDILRLVTDPATFGDVDRQLRGAEPSLVADLWLHVERKFVRERERTIRVLRETNHRDVSPDEIGDATAFLDGALSGRAT